MPSLISLIESLVTSFRYSGQADAAEIETCEKLAQDYKNAHAPIAEKHGQAAAAKRAVENKAAALQLAEWQRLVDSTRRAEMAVAQMQSGGKAEILNAFRSGVKTSSPKPATAPTKAPTAPPKPVESAMRHLSNKELCIAAGNAHGKFSKAEISAARAELIRRGYGAKGQASPAPAPAPTSGLTHSEFQKLSPRSRMQFVRDGGVLAEVSDSKTASKYAPKCMPLAEFNRLSPLEKMKHARAGGKISE
jgi:hypothetical protein